METKSDWYIKQRIIFHRSVGEENLEGVKAHNDRIVKLFDQGIPPVHLIVDTRYLTALPTNILTLRRVATILNHPSLGWIITISNDPTIRFLAGLVPQIAGLERYRILKELDMGLTFLKEKDLTLDWSSAQHQLLEE